MGSLRIGSVNCRGLSSDKIKRRDIFNKCRNNYDITFLIDTHSDKSVENVWKTEWGYEAYFNSRTSNSRGVAILFSNSFVFDVLSVKKDGSGNLLIVNINIKSCDKSIVLVAVYGPNENDDNFYHNLQNQLHICENTSIIIGGDWNVPQNYISDT